jgi:hypothetical protein
LLILFFSASFFLFKHELRKLPPVQKSDIPLA